MSGLFGELQRVSQALNAQSQGIATAGRNMANVNNPAYARQRVQLGDVGTVQTTLGPRGLGVQALDLQNIRDSLLDRQVIREGSFASSFAAQYDAFQKAQLALGQQIDRQADAQFIEGSSATTGTRGVGEALDDLLSAFSSLAAGPRSDAERQILFQKAQTLVARFHSIDGRLADVQTEVTNQIGTELATVNRLLETIAGLGQQIGRFEVGNPGSALDLRDQRQGKLEELAKFLDFEVEEIPGSSGQLRLLSRDAAENPVALLDRTTVHPVAFDGVAFSGGSPASTLALRAGSLHGHLAARDGQVADLRSGLDRFAAQIVTAVNDAYNPGGASTDFFLASGLTAADIALDPSLTAANIRATNTANPGANEVALAISDLASRRFSTAGGDLVDGTLGTFYRGLVSDVANATASALGRVEDQSTMLRLVLARRDSVSGVSLDEEMTELTKYQRAFEASARVMRVLDEMLDTVVNGIVR